MTMTRPRLFSLLQALKLTFHLKSFYAITGYEHNVSPTCFLHPVYIRALIANGYGMN